MQNKSDILCTYKQPEPTERSELTNRGPRSNLWATGAKINHKTITAHAFRLREKIAIKRISIMKDKRGNSIRKYFILKGSCNSTR